MRLPPWIHASEVQESRSWFTGWRCSVRMPDRKPAGVERPTIDVAAVSGGWPHPWANVAEIAAVLPTGKWTLIGGVMTQLHSIHHGIGIVHPTNDVDIIVHVETSRGVANETATALRSLGYDLRSRVDPRDNTAHRFYRGASRIDMVTDLPNTEEEIVDVLVSDHHAPKVTQRLDGRAMVRIEGGTQVLRRTIKCAAGDNAWPRHYYLGARTLRWARPESRCIPGRLA